ncbi:MAG: hypothetical protein ABW000_07155 [Actinoplanes sp.]
MNRIDNSLTLVGFAVLVAAVLLAWIAFQLRCDGLVPEPDGWAPGELEQFTGDWPTVVGLDLHDPRTVDPGFLEGTPTAGGQDKRVGHHTAEDARAIAWAAYGLAKPSLVERPAPAAADGERRATAGAFRLGASPVSPRADAPDRTSPGRHRHTPGVAR